MTSCVRGVTLAGLLSALLTASAVGGHERSSLSASCYSGYSYAPITGGVVYYYQVVETTPLVLPTQTSLYACPLAAPPQTSEPPTAKPEATRAPKISESRSSTAIQTDVKLEGRKPAKERYAIGFWNISGRDVLLTVAGQTRILLRNRNITLDLEREFTWQIDQQTARLVSVPPERKGMEIVIR